MGDLDHLHHEGGTPAQEVIAGADPREDAVDQANARLVARCEAARLCKERDQGRGPQVGGLPTHVWSGDEEQPPLLVEGEVVWHVARIPFQHRVTRTFQHQISALRHRGARPSPLPCHDCKAVEHIDGGHARGEHRQGAGVLGDGTAKLDEALVFQGPDARCCGQQRVVALEQFLGDKAHPVGHLLLSREGFWHLLEVRARHLDEPPNLPVLPHLQARDGEGVPELGFVGVEPCRAFVGDRAQTVDFLIDAVAKQASITKRQRRGVDQRSPDAVTQFVQAGQSFGQMHEQWIVGVVAGPLDRRQAFQRDRGGHQIPGVCSAVAGQGGQAFQVTHARQRHTQGL